MAGKKKVTEGPAIKIAPDGPYLVSGSVPLGKEIMIYGHDGIPTGWRGSDIRRRRHTHCAGAEDRTISPTATALTSR